MAKTKDKVRQIGRVFLSRKPVVLIITKCPPGEPVRCHHRVKHHPAAALLLSWPAASLSAAGGQSGRRPLSEVITSNLSQLVSLSVDQCHCLSGDSLGNLLARTTSCRSSTLGAAGSSPTKTGTTSRISSRWRIMTSVLGKYERVVDVSFDSSNHFRILPFVGFSSFAIPPVEDDNFPLEFLDVEEQREFY